MENNYKTLKILDHQLGQKNVEYIGAKSGVFSAIIEDPDVVRFFSDRENVVCKVFFTPVVDDINSMLWGRPIAVNNGEQSRNEYSYLMESIKIQNLCAFHGYAPRVYDYGFIKKFGYLYPVFVVDKLDGQPSETIEQMQEVMGELWKLGQWYGFKFTYADYARLDNTLGNKWVDFQGAFFYLNYERRLKKRYEELTKWNGNIYQNSDFSTGYRDSERLEFISQSLIDTPVFGSPETSKLFEGKNVLDVGCNGGLFSRLALKFGAKRVTAIDKLEVITGAREYNNYKGYWNIDYIEKDIENPDEIPDSEVIIYMSVYRYFGYARCLKNAKIVIYEHNGEETFESVCDRFKADGFKMTDPMVTSKDGRKSCVFYK